MLFENKIVGSDRLQFINEVKAVCGRLYIEPDWLAGVMNFETGGTFSATAYNPNGGATGLIQFMPDTAVYLGTTTAALRLMTRTQQLFYVEKYFKPAAGKYKGFEDLYLYTFYPAALLNGWPDSQKFPANVVAANPALFGTGPTLGDWRGFLRKHYAEYPELFKKKV